MFWETLGFILTAIATGLYGLFKIKKDVYPFALKKWMSRLALSNWQKQLPQKLPVYNFIAPKSTKETGIIPQDAEFVLEKPQELNQPGDADDLLFYGIDDEGNALVAKISKLWKGWTEASLFLTVNGKSYSVSYQGPASNPLEFSLGNFKLEMVEPFRAWRLWYNGKMENVENPECTSEDDLVHVTLNFLWKPLDNPCDFQKNANLDLLSECASQNGTFGQSFADLRAILPPGYFQFGSFHGDVKVDSVELPQLYLYGHRLRRYLNPSSPSGFEKSTSLGNQNHMELFGMNGFNGNAFRLMSFNDNWVDGQALYSSFQVKAISEVDVQAKSYHRDLSIPKMFKISDSKSSQTIEVWPSLQKLRCSTASNSLDIILLRLIINGKLGRGILIRKLDQISEKSVALLEKPGYYDLITNSHTITDDDALDFLEFDFKSCRRVALVGGKAASLASLAILAKQNKSEFKTAKGFCVTTNLFKRMLDLQELENIFSKDQCELDQMCSEAMKLVKSSGVEAELRSLIQPLITKIFGSGSNLVRFAVRSSGVLEDGTDLSCAGQNETFLGVDEKSIPSKIIDCWASLFTPQSVGYRLNHGQPAVSEMGVVIQEMVNVSSAGVLFTADPRTGNPFEMILTANYGLGESVVSASCDPDTIILLRSREKSAKLSSGLRSLKVGNKTLGDKKSKIVLASDGKSTKECVTNDTDAKSYCLSDEKALELGQIGTKIEKELGNLKPVDIEWAVSENGEVYILQCRSMTSLDSWTDFEIVHQFDSSIRTQFDRMTTANTGEVLPKPIYAMSVQSTGRGIDLGTEISHCMQTGEPVCPMLARCAPIYGQRMHLNMYHILYSIVDDKPTPANGCIDLAVFGRNVMDKEIHAVAVERHGISSPMSKIQGLLRAFKIVRGSPKMMLKGNEMFGELELDYDSIEQTSKAVYDKITEDLLHVQKAGQLHVSLSEISSTTLVFAFLAVTEGREVKDWTSSLYEVAGTLLSAHSAVESAEMPGDIDELGRAIVKLGENHQEFLNMNGTTEAMSWLRGQKGLGDALDKFLKRHGHRAIAEMDLGNKSWRTDPTPLVNLLKNIVRNKLESKDSDKAEIKAGTKGKSVEELLDSLKTPLKSGSRWFLKFILPHCREAVANRERTKSLLVRTIDQLKQGYYRLSYLMVKERLIPDENLLRHLTHTEMGLLINKDPTTSTILYRAMRRMKLYPSVEAFDYPEISMGIPKPIDNAIPIEVTDVVKATPVSSGKVQGIAKVCLSVEEASELIRPGDILITKGTDIAWSPFFPLLGGVVTELGGLISHGAVVAREYGLPCIVGAVNATKIFKTGDLVILDTSTGTLSKVKTKRNLPTTIAETESIPKAMDHQNE